MGLHNNNNNANNNNIIIKQPLKELHLLICNYENQLDDKLAQTSLTSECGSHHMLSYSPDVQPILGFI